LMGVYGRFVMLGPSCKGTDVVAVLVRDKDGVDVGWTNPQWLQRRLDCAVRKASVHQHIGAFVLHQGAVAVASAEKCCKPH